MAAYAALVSLMYTIDQIKHHPRPPISLDKDQVESLTGNVTFLQEFLEDYSQLYVGYSNEADPLEMHIADAAYAAENVIESHIVDQIRGSGSTSSDEEKISSVDFYGGLKKVIVEMDSIKKEVIEIKVKKMGVQDLQRRTSSITSASLSSSNIVQKQNVAMVGFDDVLLEIMNELTGGQPGRLIIPIVGMGGIGKTTLARNLYAKPLVREHFDICAWVAISQEYNTQEILKELLSQAKPDRSFKSENELGLELYQCLSGRRYMIIMDDMWSIESWDEIKFLFPDDNNGSRVVVTTRLLSLACQLTDYYCLKMKFLDEDQSWNLFSRTVFGEDDCPLELEKIGKKIVENCKGLPLLIVVIGGLLTKCKHTLEYWEYIAENLTLAANSEDDDNCLKILYTSYNQLPVHLKPCFLYMGLYPEDSIISVSQLIKLWVEEGFLKSVSGKSLEETAEEYLRELINRNLILVHKLGCTGNIKYCHIHDLVRDLCLREAQKQRFYYISKRHSLDLLQGIDTRRCIAVINNTSPEKLITHWQYVSLSHPLMKDILKAPPSINCRFLMLLHRSNQYSDDRNFFLENISQLVNSRHLAVRYDLGPKLGSSLHIHWNLHTLILNGLIGKIVSVNIWKMPQLKHVVTSRLSLSDPPSGRDDTVLENLQTLRRIFNFKCGEELVKRIPNIKKLVITYDIQNKIGAQQCLGNLERLHKLTSFCCYSTLVFVKNITFPRSLVKLAMEINHGQYWEDILEKAGSLPHLEKLVLTSGSFKGNRWETVEGQFPSLKFLLIEIRSLRYWITDSTHFPCLKQLVLSNLAQLEIPLSIGEISTLETIVLDTCSISTALSAKKVLDEQEELGNESLHIRAINNWSKKELESLASPNFHVSDLVSQRRRRYV